jgi:hypothetical protein
MEVVMSRYRFIVGVSVAALESEVNRLVEDDPGLNLKQVFLAPGTGFVAVLEDCEGAERGVASGDHAAQKPQTPLNAEKREKVRKPDKAKTMKPGSRKGA